MTRAEYDRLNLDGVEALLRKNGASSAAIEAAMMAILEENDDAVLAYINGNKAALNEYLDEDSNNFEFSSAVSMFREHRMRCNVCGKVFCYTDEDLQANQKYQKEAAGHAVGSLVNALFGSQYLRVEEDKKMETAKSKIVDYSRCPNCKSTNIKEIFENEAVMEKPNRNMTATTSAADEIKKFKELLDCGIITREEFDAKKKQLLGL